VNCVELISHAAGIIVAVKWVEKVTEFLVCYCLACFMKSNNEHITWQPCLSACTSVT